MRTGVARALASVTMVAALVAGACSSSEAPVVVMVAGDPAELKAYRDVVAGFEETDPGFDVRLIELADRDELIARLSTSIAGGDPPDVFLLNYRYHGQFVAKGQIEPVTVYLADSDVLSRDAFFPAALAPFETDGELLCLPQNVSSLVVYYNRELFRRARVPVPRAGWSHAELLDTARRLDGRAGAHGIGTEATIERVAPFVWSAGGELVDDPENPARITLRSAATRRGLRNFMALARYAPSEREAVSKDLETRFVDGRYALGSTTVIVTAGVGYSIVPLRYASPGSIEVIDLRL